MQIVSFLFKKFIVLESPEIRYYLKNPISKTVLVEDDMTGTEKLETVIQEYVPFYTDITLVRKRFDPDDINFKLLIPICGSCEDSFVDSDLMKVFIDIDNESLDVSSIQQFINYLENIMLPYSDQSTNYNYLKSFLTDYYRYFCSINLEKSISEEEFLNKIFNGYISIMQDFSFVERKPLLLEFYRNIYVAFKSNIIDTLTEELNVLSQNKADLDSENKVIDGLSEFDKLMKTKEDLQNINELQLKRDIANLESRLTTLSNDFQLAVEKNDYNSISRLMDEAQTLNAEIIEVSTKYSDMYETIKSIKNQN